METIHKNIYCMNSIELFKKNKLKAGQLMIIKFFNDGYILKNNGRVLNSKGKFLKPTTNKGGYQRITFRGYDGLFRSVLIHRLMAFKKYGFKLFKEKIVVRHLNGKKSDNSFGNILIGTQLDNILDKPKKQRILDASHPYYDHSAILKDRELGLTYRELMAKYGITSKGTLSFIINKSLKSKKII